MVATWKCTNIPLKPDATGHWDMSRAKCNQEPYAFFWFNQEKCKIGPFDPNSNNHFVNKDIECS